MFKPKFKFISKYISYIIIDFISYKLVVMNWSHFFFLKTVFRNTQSNILCIIPISKRENGKPKNKGFGYLLMQNSKVTNLMYLFIYIVITLIKCENIIIIFLKKLVIIYRVP